MEIIEETITAIEDSIILDIILNLEKTIILEEISYLKNSTTIDSSMVEDFWIEEDFSIEEEIIIIAISTIITIYLEETELKVDIIEETIDSLIITVPLIITLTVSTLIRVIFI